MRVVIADGRAQVRSALRLVLEHELDMSVVGEARDVSALLALVAAGDADVVLLDWELPGMGRPGDCANAEQRVRQSRSGYDLLCTLRDRSPALKAIVLSGRPEARQAAIVAGANGFVSKGDSPDQLLAEIGALRQGGSR